MAFGADDENECVTAVLAYLRSVAEVEVVPGDQWPDFSEAVGRRVAQGSVRYGFLMCWTGTGTAIAANKVPGVRCALAWSVETATLARQHNDAQVMGIGGRMHTVEQAFEIIDAFLGAEWSNAERHQRRIDILAEYERTHVAPPVPGAPA